MFNDLSKLIKKLAHILLTPGHIFASIIMILAIIGLVKVLVTSIKAFIKRQKISILSICSLFISIIAFIQYCIVLSGPSVTIPFWFFGLAVHCWSITSIFALIVPILAKWHRKLKGYKGKTLEIVTLIIGAYNFYFAILLTTQIPLYICYAIIIVCCVLYAKLFNKDNETLAIEPSEEETLHIMQEKQNLEKELRALTKAPNTERNVRRCNEIKNQLKNIETMLPKKYK